MACAIPFVNPSRNSYRGHTGDKMDNRFRITWGVCKSGYRWAEEEEIKRKGIAQLSEGTLGPAPYLVPVIEDQNGPYDPHIELYNPLSSPTLFGVFADLPATQEEMLTFANRYGLLRAYFAPESFSDWEKEIRLLRQAVWLWERWRDNDKLALSDCIRWRSGQLTFSGIYGSEGRERDYTPLVVKDMKAQVRAEIDGGPTPLYFSEEFKPGDVIGPAKSFVSRLISQRLGAEVSAAFGPDGVSFNLKTPVGAMWVQFAEAVSGKAEYIRCAIPSCRSWVQVKEKAKGKGKMYCSERCKKRAQRQRRSKP